MTPEVTAAPLADVPMRTAILHIGLSKAAAAFLDAALSANQDTLIAAGADYLDRGSRELRATLRAPARDRTTLASAGARVAERVAQSSSEVVVLSVPSARRASPEEIAAMADSLGEVRVIVTVADVGDEAIASWCEAVLNGGRSSLAAFVQELAETVDSATSPTGLAADLPEVVRNWSSVLGPDAVTVVALPSGEPGPEHWAAFAAAAGPPLSHVDLDSAPVTGPALSYSDLDLLRRLNDEVLRRLTKAEYERGVRDFLVPEIAALSSTSEAETLERPSLTPSQRTWAHEQTASRMASLEGLGVHVITAAGSEPNPDEPAEGPAGRPLVEYPDAAIRAMRKLVLKIAAVESEAVGGTRRRPRKRSGGNA